MTDRDDVGADGDEAEAQRAETVMPWIWGAIGVAVIAVFVVAVFASGQSGHFSRHPPGLAPVFKPLNRGY